MVGLSGGSRVNRPWRLNDTKDSFDSHLLLRFAVELGILNSREFQLELEKLFLVSPALTLERFEFDVQWFGLTETFFRHFGTSSIDDPLSSVFAGNETNTLRTTSTLGLSRVSRRRPAAGGLCQHVHALEPLPVPEPAAPPEPPVLLEPGRALRSSVLIGCPSCTGRCSE